MHRDGSTLIELIVVLALLALLIALVPASIIVREAPRDQVLLLRARAVREGVRLQALDPDSVPILLLPDGRVLANGRDPLTGRSRDDAR